MDGGRCEGEEGDEEDQTKGEEKNKIISHFFFAAEDAGLYKIAAGSLPLWKRRTPTDYFIAGPE